MSLLEIYSWGALMFFLMLSRADGVSPIGASVFAAAWPAVAVYFAYAVVWEVQHRTRLWWQRRNVR